jgi:hypothetical protein
MCVCNVVTLCKSHCSVVTSQGFACKLVPGLQFSSGGYDRTAASSKVKGTIMVSAEKQESKRNESVHRQIENEAF